MLDSSFQLIRETDEFQSAFHTKFVEKLTPLLVHLNGGLKKLQ